LVRRQLGRTGLTVSSVALGTTKLGRNTGVKYPVDFALPSDQEVAALLESARQLGVNLIDTAPAYGESERRLGPFVNNHRD
jgi:aryl-alcohol dehydrogenase-like predicted oxidoreductase